MKNNYYFENDCYFISDDQYKNDNNFIESSLIEKIDKIDFESPYYNKIRASSKIIAYVKKQS